MADNLNLTGKQDDIRININQQHEVSYWTRTLGVSEARLRQAHKAAGPLVKNIRTWLRNN